MKLDIDNCIIVNLKNSDNYLEKTFDVLYKKFSNNLFLLSNVKGIIILINGSIEHVCSLYINPKNIFPKFYITEDDYDIKNLNDNKYLELFNNYSVGNVACKYLAFDFSKKKEFDNINFIRKFYNTNYKIASIAYETLNRLKKDKMMQHLKLITEEDNKFYVDSRLIKVAIYILSKIVINKIFQIEEDEIVSIICDLLIILIKDGKVKIFEKKYFNMLKKRLKKHIKEIQDFFRKKTYREKLKKFFIEWIKYIKERF